MYIDPRYERRKKGNKVFRNKNSFKAWSEWMRNQFSEQPIGVAFLAVAAWARLVPPNLKTNMMKHSTQDFKRASRIREFEDAIPTRRTLGLGQWKATKLRIKPEFDDAISKTTTLRSPMPVFVECRKWKSVASELWLGSENSRIRREPLGVLKLFPAPRHRVHLWQSAMRRRRSTHMCLHGNQVETRTRL